MTGTLRLMSSGGKGEKQGERDIEWWKKGKEREKEGKVVGKQR